MNAAVELESLRQVFSLGQVTVIECPGFLATRFEAVGIALPELRISGSGGESSEDPGGEWEPPRGLVCLKSGHGHKVIGIDTWGLDAASEDLTTEQMGLAQVWCKRVGTLP